MFTFSNKKKKKEKNLSMHRFTMGDRNTGKSIVQLSTEGSQLIWSFKDFKRNL